MEATTPATPALEAPALEVDATAPQVTPEAPGFDTRRYAIYALVAAGVAAYVLLRARTIARSRMALEGAAGNGGQPNAAQAALESLPGELQVVLRQYADATELRLATAADNIDQLKAHMAEFRERVAILEGMTPIAGRTEPFTTPANGAFSARDADVHLDSAVDGGSLEAVPPMVGADAE